MRFEDARVLREWALLQFDRVSSRVPDLDLTCERKLIHKSKGFKKLRAWYVRLSPAAKVRALRWMQQQIKGVRMIINDAAARGEVLTAADIEDINFIIEDGGDDGTQRDAPGNDQVDADGRAADGQGDEAPGGGPGGSGLEGLGAGSEDR